ncbi:MAG: GNAT family N-acetyltransferase [Nitrospirae bacterium]|nr:GNAT family N-acetyltransferase [Nitrospirota bacterium]
MNSIFLEGKSIYLGPLSQEGNLDKYASWINSQKNTVFMESGKFPSTPEGLKDYISSYNSSKTGMLLGIFLKKGSKHIGNITINSIDWRSRHAKVGVIVAEEGSQGKGYATEAINLVAGHAFNKLNLRKLYAGVIEGNEASRRAFEKAGFKPEGKFKEYFYLNGEYLDCDIMGLLKK